MSAASIKTRIGLCRCFEQSSGTCNDKSGKHRRSRILCWKWQTGTLLHDHRYDKKLDGHFSFDGFVRPLDWLPDGSGWMVQGKLVVDKLSGKELAPLLSVADEWGDGLKRLVSTNMLIVGKEARIGGRSRKTLELVPVDPKKALAEIDR